MTILPWTATPVPGQQESRASSPSPDPYPRSRPSASSSLSEALDSIRKASRKDTRLSEYLDRTESIGIEADDILLSVRSHLSGIDFPESEMEAKNERLMQLQRIRRRFGGSIEEAIRRRDEYKRKLEEAEQGDSIIEKLSERLEN